MNETITYHYFVAEGLEATGAKAGGLAGMETYRKQMKDLMAKYGADCLWGGRRSAPGGIGFLWTEKTPPPMKENFLKPHIERSGDNRYAVYYPDQRYKGGKTIKKDLASVGGFNFSDYVVKCLGVDRSVFGILDGRQVMASSTAGLYGETLIIQIPVGGDHGEFECPEFLRKIKKSEFIAITEEQD